MFLYKLKLSNEFLVEESETQEIAEQKYGFEICYKAINLICCLNFNTSSSCYVVISADSGLWRLYYRL